MDTKTAHLEQIKWRLQKSLRRYPDAEITSRTPYGAQDGFAAEIKRGRKTSIFALSGLEIVQAADKLDDLISARLTTTLLR